MEKTIIEGVRHGLYKSFEELYKSSFPIFEQRTQAHQEKAFACNNYHIVGYKEDNIFIGFISYWKLEGYVYIEHFAIHQALRGKGYGSEALRDFILSVASDIVLLEIDPTIDEVSKARLRFYTQNGFYENPYPHTHPPYREGYDAHPLVILSTQRKITNEEYLRFDTELKEIVMNKKE